MYFPNDIFTIYLQLLKTQYSYLENLDNKLVGSDYERETFENSALSVPQAIGYNVFIIINKRKIDILFVKCKRYLNFTLYRKNEVEYIH